MKKRDLQNFFALLAYGVAGLIVGYLLGATARAAEPEPEPIEPVVVVRLIREEPVAEPAAAHVEPQEPDLYREDIPLTREEQEALRAACEETGIPLELALGLIERETNFRNIMGDGGDSTGYMQVQAKWHAARMERLGVTDLTDPASNFRVGLDYLAEQIERYGSVESGLVAYNQGHYKGTVTKYALAVLANAEKWRNENA